MFNKLAGTRGHSGNSTGVNGHGRHKLVSVSLNSKLAHLTMRGYWLLPILLFPAIAGAATVTCPESADLAGAFVATAAPGFTPNRLVLQFIKDDTYQLSLTTYWAPVPHDNGTRGTIGDFEGKVFLPKPWSCVALFSRPENDCHLILRFRGKQTVYVESRGRCELYHGANAYPQGRYEKH